MRYRFLAILLAALTTSVAAYADGTGTQVTGTFLVNHGTTNYFDPANGFVPPGFGNSAGTTVTIGPGVEFGFADGANFNSVNFSGSGLNFIDISTLGTIDFEMDFTDPAFTSFTQLTGYPGLTYSFSGDTLRLFRTTTLKPGIYDTTFRYTTNAAITPEPSSVALMATGLLGLMWMAWRRYGDQLGAGAALRF